MNIEDPNLHGLRILNTRPACQNQDVSQLIKTHNGISVELPLVEIKPTDAVWKKDLPPLQSIDGIIFISTNAVHYFFQSITPKEFPVNIPVFAIGLATKKALKKVVKNHIYVPSQPDSEHLLTISELQDIKKQSFVLIKGKNGRTIIRDTLKRRQAKITEISVYERILPGYDPQILDLMWRTDAVDIILFTSEQSMRHIFKIFRKEQHAWIYNKPWLVISNRLADIAAQMGAVQILTTSTKDLITCLAHHIKGRYPNDYGKESK